jgi:hypothetical protein
VKKIKPRWLFPICHLVIDLAIALMLLHRIHSVLENEKFVDPGVFHADWHVNLPPSRTFTLLAMGTLPIALLSISIIPEFDVSTRQHPFNFRWLALHEALAMAFWFGLGSLCERSLKLRNILLAFVGLRAVAAFWLLLNVPEVGVLFNELFWLLFTIFLTVWGVRHLVRQAWGRHDGGEPTSTST